MGLSLLARHPNSAKGKRQRAEGAKRDFGALGAAAEAYKEQPDQPWPIVKPKN